MVGRLYFTPFIRARTAQDSLNVKHREFDLGFTLLLDARKCVGWKSRNEG